MKKFLLYIFCFFLAALLFSAVEVMFSRDEAIESIIIGVLAKVLYDHEP